MKTKSLIPLALGLCLLSPFTTHAQFSSGSTGADGALNVTTSTNLNLPPDGIFNFTTITVAAGATLTFTKNALNTPVYLLATGDVVITGAIGVNGTASSGSIPGVGGLGGFDGGFGAFQGFPNGGGQGPGAGSQQYPGAVFAFPLGSNTNIYGNTLLSPLIGGSGGHSGGNGGGGGGGAILLASSTRVTMSGGSRIDAFGGGGWGGGSGGAIRLVAPIVDGSGSLRAIAGGGSYGGTDGRTRIDSTDRFAHRNIILSGKATRGSQMVLFPPGNPKLDIINAAGTSIPVGTNGPVTVNLPVGANTNQVVRVQATGFTGDIPIRVKITPENAPSAIFDGVILQSSGNPPFADVPITLPLDTVCYVHAWTR